MSDELESLAKELDNSSARRRIQAVEVLGVRATEGSYNSIELLARTMQTDRDIDVRIAATEALARIEAPNVEKEIESLIPMRDRIETPSQLSLLKSAWYR